MIPDWAAQKWKSLPATDGSPKMPMCSQEIFPLEDSTKKGVIMHHVAPGSHQINPEKVSTETVEKWQ